APDAPCAASLVCGRGPWLRFALARLPMGRVRLAPTAVLAQLDPLRIVALALVRLVVPSLAVFACERDCDPDVSAGHGRSKVDVGTCPRPGGGQTCARQSARASQCSVERPGGGPLGAASR